MCLLMQCTSIYLSSVYMWCILATVFISCQVTFRFLWANHLYKACVPICAFCLCISITVCGVISISVTSITMWYWFPVFLNFNWCYFRYLPFSVPLSFWYYWWQCVSLSFPYLFLILILILCFCCLNVSCQCINLIVIFWYLYVVFLMCWHMYNICFNFLWRSIWFFPTFSWPWVFAIYFKIISFLFSWPQGYCPWVSKSIYSALILL